MEEITVKGAEAVFESKAYREPKALAEELSRRGTAYVLVSDAAENDGEHEESIGFMRRLFRELPVPAAAGGYIRRLEDVKKYLYAGASAVWFKEGQEAVMEEAKKGRFLSREDFCQRTKVSKTLADTMGELGLLGDIPMTNQISLFDLELL